MDHLLAIAAAEEKQSVGTNNKKIDDLTGAI
jgi:hypothetical protein